MQIFYPTLGPHSLTASSRTRQPILPSPPLHHLQPLVRLCDILVRRKPDPRTSRRPLLPLPYDRLAIHIRHAGLGALCTVLGVLWGRRAGRVAWGVVAFKIAFHKGIVGHVLVVLDFLVQSALQL
jgi:hypothetical protein